MTEDTNLGDRRSANRRMLLIVLVLVIGNMGLELAGGLESGSLALIADAVHDLDDVAAVGLALFSIWVAGRPPSIERTFGYHRAEVFACLANALLIWVFTAWIFFAAFQRTEEASEVEGPLMLIFGAIGLAISVVTVLLLLRPSRNDLNIAGVFQHVLADVMGSVGIVISGVLLIFFEWNWLDTVVSVIIGLIILYSSWGLIRRTFSVLLEGTPTHLDLYRLCSEFEVEGVTLLHDVHAWTISSGYDALTAHILVDTDTVADKDELLRRLRRIAREDFGISHVTIQLDETLDDCNHEDHHVGHLEARARNR